MISFILEGVGSSVTLPINPSELTIERGNDNVYENVVELGQIVIVRAPKLAKIKLEAFFPGVEYYYATGGANPSVQVMAIKNMFDKKKPIRFIVTGLNENMQVVIDSFSHERRAGEHEDIYYKLSMTEFRPYGATLLEVVSDGNIGKNDENSDDKPLLNNSIYTVKNGDSLWSVARKNSNGASWKELYELNREVVGANPNLIHPGLSLNLPESWLL